MSEGSETVNVQTLRKLLKCLKTAPKEDDLAENPSNLTLPLFQHQQRALSWLLWREKQNPSGGLLADDMGLGKTLTMISLVLKSLELNPKAKTIRKSEGYYHGGTLIVCPTSLLDQWASEIEGKTKPGSLSVEIYHGKDRETKAKRLAKHDIVITTYGIIRNESSSDGPIPPIFDIKWRRIILDEAHEIRNHTTQVCEAACDLEGKSRWALTGTPIHNRESDMYAILKFLRYEPFDDLQVWEEWFQDEDPEGQRRQQVVVASFMLRRTKADMIAQGLFQNLPQQDKKLVNIDLEDEEMDLYRQIYERSRARFRLYLDENQSEGDTRRETNLPATATGKNTNTILNLLLRLRQICNHPHLIQETILNGELDVDSDPSNEVFSENYRSTKIKMLLQFLKDKIDSGDKVVVVSQWTSFLQIVGTHLEEEKIKFETFHGAIKADERMPIVKNINNPKSKTKVLLLSLKAGGVGLNLIGANHLFLLDLYWNPQLEIQAQDRIYRMGQTKQVFIYKFLANGTVEEKIKDLQEKKMKIMTTILQGAQHQDNLTLKELKFLFDLA